MVDVDPPGLDGRGLDLEATGGGVRLRVGGAGLGGFETAAEPVERVPAEAETVRKQDDRGEGQRRGQGPSRGSDQPEQIARAHGKAFRSSSKCGPSRSRGQSPPQTIGVPCRAAAALKAAAMRG